MNDREPWKFAGKLIQYGAGSIYRAVVDDHPLQRQNGLPGDRSDRRLEMILLVTDGSDYHVFYVLRHD
jgi:hypothetical protein